MSCLVLMATEAELLEDFIHECVFQDGSGPCLGVFSFPAFEFTIMKMKVEWIFLKVTKSSKANQGMGSEI